MGNQKFIVSSSSVLRKAHKLLVPAEFAVVSTHQPALVLRGGLWSVLLMCKEGLCRFIRYIPEEVAEASQIFLRDVYVLPKLFSY
jgi:hypothetical protein